MPSLIFGDTLTLRTEPVAYWGPAITGLALAGVVAVVVAVMRHHDPGVGSTHRRRASAIALGAFTALGLWLAGLNASIVVERQAPNLHVILLADVSESAERGAPEGGSARRRLSSWIEAALASDRDRRFSGSTGSAVVFAARPLVRDQVPLGDLSGVLQTLDRGQDIDRNGTQLEQALREAARLARAASGRPVAVLATDGQQTDGDALRAATQLALTGVPIYVVPVESRAPSSGIAAAYLPPNVEAGVRTSVRVVLRNPTEHKLALRLRCSVPSTGWSQEITREVGPAASVPVSIPVVFDDPGLRHVEVDLDSAQPGHQQQRRLFTLVTRQPRVLVVGEMPAWSEWLPKDSYALQSWTGSPFEPERFDIVVLNGVDAPRLGSENLGRLAEAVERAGTGTLLINGPHTAGEHAPTVIMSFKDTPLDRLLPVTTGPPPTPEVPGRRVVLMIDTSGSMGGWKLQKAKQLAKVIVEQTTARDRVRIVTFSDGYENVLPEEPASDDLRARALAVLDGLSAGGGTDPTSALDLVPGRDCGLFFLSDGDFELKSHTLGCVTRALALLNHAGEPPETMRQLGDAYAITADTDPRSLVLGFFQPKPDDRYFEPGLYAPDWLGDLAVLQPARPLKLEGTAITYERSTAQLASVRPWPWDPVLAFLQSKGGTVGALTTGVGAEWDCDDGGAALHRWLQYLLRWSAPNRYLARAADQGGRISLDVTLLADGRNPIAHGLSLDGSLEALDSVPTSVRLRRDPVLPGKYVGEIALPPDKPERDAVLVIREHGPGALNRPQRIPIELPASTATRRPLTSEAWTWALNEDLLRSIATATGGLYDPVPEILLATVGEGHRRVFELWPWLLLVAAAAYVAQIALRRLAT